MIGMLAFIAIKLFYSRSIKLFEKVTVNKTLVIVCGSKSKILLGDRNSTLSTMGDFLKGMIIRVVIF